MGLVGLEPTPPALSRRCSNQLSYRPEPVALTQARAQAVGDNLPTTDKCERSNLTALLAPAALRASLCLRKMSIR